jgi:hypothetical protein
VSQRASGPRGFAQWDRLRFSVIAQCQLHRMLSLGVAEGHVATYWLRLQSLTQLSYWRRINSTPCWANRLGIRIPQVTRRLFRVALARSDRVTREGRTIEIRLILDIFENDDIFLGSDHQAQPL